MGVAYYIELDNPELDIDDINGKSVARAMEELTALSEELGVESLESFMGQSMEDFSDLIGEEIEMEEGVDGAATWFDPQEGIVAIDALIAELSRNPKRFTDSAGILEDLNDYKSALEKAAEAGAKWHLAIDI